MGTPIESPPGGWGYARERICEDQFRADLNLLCQLKPGHEGTHQFVQHGERWEWDSNGLHTHTTTHRPHGIEPQQYDRERHGIAWAKVRLNIPQVHEALSLSPQYRIERLRVTEDPDMLWVYVSGEDIETIHPESEAPIIQHLGQLRFTVPENRCRATNTEGALCVRERGHDHLHRPIEGREWATTEYLS